MTKPCKYCGGIVAVNAKACPQCGGIDPYPASLRGYGCLAVLGIALLVAFALGRGSCEESSKSDSAMRDSNQGSVSPSSPAESAMNEFNGMTPAALQAKVQTLRDAILVVKAKVAVERSRVEGIRLSENRPLYNGPILGELTRELQSALTRLEAAERQLRATGTSMPATKPATKPAAKQTGFNAGKAAVGRKIHARILSQHPAIDEYYAKIDKTLSIMTLPEDEWNCLSAAEQDAIGHFMESEVPGYWIVYIGRITPGGRDIYADRRGLTSYEWRGNIVNGE